MLAKFASNPELSKGRFYQEEIALKEYRTCFQQDKDRIVHSNAFRRLEYKTQVFINHEGDHYRNRLTHSIEVAGVARLIARALGLSEDLAEAIALAHDIGHTPFGHAGEHALDACMKPYGGFSHNAYSIKLLTTLEQRYAKFTGLNLSWEVLEGLAKHNGPLTTDMPEFIRGYNNIYDLDLARFPSIEAQVASLADDIAYHSHDIEDGVRAGLITIDDLRKIPILSQSIDNWSRECKDISTSRLVYETVRELMHVFIADVIVETKKNIASNHIETAEDARNLGAMTVRLSQAMREYNAQIKTMLFAELYKDHVVATTTYKAKRVVQELFKIYMNSPECMPVEWQQFALLSDKNSLAIAVSDYIAGMTDRYAIKELQSFYNLSFNKLF